MATTYAVTAAATTLSYGADLEPFSLRNESASDVYGRRQGSSSTTFAGNAAELDALSSFRLEQGQVWTVPRGWSGVDLVCATALTATLQIGAGDLDNAAAASAGDTTAANQVLQLAQETLIAGDTTSMEAIMAGVTMGAGVVTAGTQRVTLPTNDPAVALLTTVAAGFAAEGEALGSGVLLQGDDGTDRTNLAVDTDGHPQVDVLTLPALPAGTNNIGDMDILSVIPGVGATNLGKAEDAAHTTADVGVMALAVRQEALAIGGGGDGDYTPAFLNCSNQVYVQPQPHRHLAEMSVHTNWTAIDDAADTLATSLNHVIGTGAVSYNKADGTAHTFGGIYDVVTSMDLRAYHKNEGFITCSFRLPSTGDYANCDFFAIRLGTDATNYNEWRISYNDGDGFLANEWQTAKLRIMEPSTYAGNGWNPAAVTYVAVGFGFDNEDDEVAAILVDHISVSQGLNVSADLAAAATATLASAVVRVKRIGANANDIVTMGAGDISTGTQRMTLADDDTNLAALNAALVGSGAPTVDSYDSAVVDCASGATTEVIATPGASKQLWIYGLLGTADTVDTTIVLKSAATAKSGTMPMADNGGFVMNPSGNFSQPWIKCATNEAFQITTAAGTFDGIVVYAIVSV